MNTITKKQFKEEIENIKKQGLFKTERQICSPQSTNISVRLSKRGKEETKINMCSNNYLGLSSHPDIIKAAQSGLKKHGYGMSSVRFICGTQDIHIELEEKIASFLKMDAAILFSSCFDANAALFEPLLGAEDEIFPDKLIHASLIDGIRLTKAKKTIYEHSNMKMLEEGLKKSTARIKMIVTDGVFSMDGDMAKLDEIVKLAKKYDALVTLDDSHATGFIGKNGRGTHEYFNVIKNVDIITTTFGKALGGALGGCISGKSEIIALLRQKARPYLFSNSLMPAIASATIKAIDLILESTKRRDKLENLSNWWREALIESKFDIKHGNTPIVPIMLYDAKVAQEFSKNLYKEGIYAIGFFYPVVPKGEARIRTQISANHSLKQLKIALNIFKKVKKQLKM